MAAALALSGPPPWPGEPVTASTSRGCDPGDGPQCPGSQPGTGPAALVRPGLPGGRWSHHERTGGHTRPPTYQRTPAMLPAYARANTPTANPGEVPAAGAFASALSTVAKAQHQKKRSRVEGHRDAVGEAGTTLWPSCRRSCGLPVLLPHGGERGQLGRSGKSASSCRRTEVRSQDWTRCSAHRGC
jgi:hypothetical protein